VLWLGTASDVLMILRRTLRETVINIALGSTVAAAAGIPLAREAFIPDALLGAVPTPISHLAIIGKILLSVLALLVIFPAALRDHRGEIYRRLAAMPLVRTALVAGAVIAAGLAAFDVCTAYHGAEHDMSGMCYCWVTGALAAAGALLVALAGIAGRTILAFTHNLLRIVIALIVRLAPTCEKSALLSGGIRPRRISTAPLLSRRIAGRAPPRFA
jgi:hypothetical protein